MFYIEKGDLCFKSRGMSIKNFGFNLKVYDTVLTSKINAVTACDCNENVAIIRTEYYDLTLRAEKAAKGALFFVSAKIKKTIKTATEFMVRFKINANPVTCVYNTIYGINGSEIFDMQSQAKTETLVEGGSATGAGYVSFSARKKKYGVIGSVTYENYFNTVTVNENGSVFVRANLNGQNFAENSVFNLDEFCVITENSPDILFSYGKLIAKKNGIKDRPIDKLAGWCSWYYYGQNITEENLLQNLDLLAAKTEGFKLFQIDDGWEKRLGDWTENEKFPHGMKYLCDKIKEKGFIPGIWVAPFYFADDSETFINHKEWFVKAQTDRNYIDYSVKGAADFLRDLFKKLSYEWGYRYIKIDLISYNIAGCGYSRADFSPLKNYRTALKIIKESVTADTKILTCTSPIDASAGLCDSVRTSIDIFEDFNAVKEVAKMVYKRNFVSEFAVADPDCFMVRTPDKQDGECFRFCTRSETEIRTFKTFIRSVGGTTMISDKLSLLDEKDFGKYAELLPINARAGVPLDLYKRDYPSVIDMGEDETFRTVALINWEDEEKTFCFFAGKNDGILLTYKNVEIESSDTVKVKLAAHDSEILKIKLKKDL